MELIKKSLNESLKVLNGFIHEESNIQAIEAAGRIMVSSLKAGGKIISFGNGGSMSDAMHFAEELTGRFRNNRSAISAISISDPAHITCVANDFGFDEIFSRFLDANGKRGDVALAISTSGNSANVVKACEIAVQKGIKVVALTGKTGGKLAPLSDVGIRVAHDGYSDRVQEVHIKVIHVLVEYIEKYYLGS